MSWQNWNFHIGFNGREGLTIHQVSYEDKGEKRPIIHRASVAEMVVNYSDFTEIRGRSEEHTSELQSLMRISYAVFCLKKKTNNKTTCKNLARDRGNIKTLQLRKEI